MYYDRCFSSRSFTVGCRALVARGHRGEPHGLHGAHVPSSLSLPWPCPSHHSSGNHYFYDLRKAIEASKMEQNIPATPHGRRQFVPGWNGVTRNSVGYGQVSGSVGRRGWCVREIMIEPKHQTESHGKSGGNQPIAKIAAKKR